MSMHITWLQLSLRPHVDLAGPSYMQTSTSELVETNAKGIRIQFLYQMQIFFSWMMCKACC